MSRQSGTRKRVTAALVALLTVLSVAVPLLDRGGPRQESTVHAEHPLSTHPGAHDHTICIQHSANAWLAPDAVTAPHRPEEWLLPEEATAFPLVPTPYRHARRSRAPPVL